MKQSGKIAMIIWSILLFPCVFAAITAPSGILDATMNWIFSLHSILPSMFMLWLYPSAFLVLLSHYLVPQIVTLIIVNINLIPLLQKWSPKPTQKEIATTVIWSVVAVHSAICAYLAPSIPT